MIYRHRMLLLVCERLWDFRFRMNCTDGVIFNLAFCVFGYRLIDWIGVMKLAVFLAAKRL